MNIKTIYLEKGAESYQRCREILDKYSAAKIIKVDSHWNIPELNQNEDLVERWNEIKDKTLILGVKKSLKVRENGRSSDFIAPSHTFGCKSACLYCFSARRREFANPITTFVNIEEIKSYITKHSQSLSDKTPNQTDPNYWVYEIGENNDCSIDDLISNNIYDLIQLFKTLPNSKATFATKNVNRKLLDYDPQLKTRIRFSLMPNSISQKVDIRTSSISERIKAINDFVEAGYEVHINLSPVILFRNWREAYKELFKEINSELTPASKKQLKAEVIFLTHNKDLHEINLRWNPKGEEIIWTPQIQEAKISENGMENIRYERQLKAKSIKLFKSLMQQELPYCDIRYMF